jgi:hypothetical protein
MLKFNKDNLLQRLEKLDEKQRALFALATAKRLAVDENDSDLEKVLANFEIMVKSDEEYDRDSITAFVYAISTVGGGRADTAAAVAQKGYERADEVAQKQLHISDYSEESEEKLKQSKAVQDELQVQEDTLKRLESE